MCFGFAELFFWADIESQRLVEALPVQLYLNNGLPLCGATILVLIKALDLIRSRVILHRDTRRNLESADLIYDFEFTAQILLR